MTTFRFDYIHAVEQSAQSLDCPVLSPASLCTQAVIVSAKFLGTGSCSLCTSCSMPYKHQLCSR